jgi:hypothetical protein
MANVTECVEKLVAGGQISRKIADEALEFLRRGTACRSSRATVVARERSDGDGL